MERSVGEGEDLSQASGAALAWIVAGVQNVDRRMDQIARATDEQAQGAEAIGAAMRRVSQLVDQTVGAAREQSSGSKVIAAAMEEIDEMVRRINQACSEQDRGGQQIGAAMEDIRRSAEANLASTNLLQDAVQSQNRQIGVLREQMGAFRIDATPLQERKPLLPRGRGARPSGRPKSVSRCPLGRWPSPDRKGGDLPSAATPPCRQRVALAGSPEPARTCDILQLQASCGVLKNPC